MFEAQMRSSASMATGNRMGGESLDIREIG
jgi:hypothetical protein